MSNKNIINTLKCVLEARSIEFMAEKFDISEQGVKSRLSNLYKHYNVRNKYELMALFIDVPKTINRITEDAQSLDVRDYILISPKSSDGLAEKLNPKPPKKESPSCALDNIWK